MINGDKVAVRAGLFVETSPFCVSFDGIEPSKLQASLIFPVDPSLSSGSDDEPDNWSTDAKLKLKVGVVSVAVKQRVGCKTVNRCWTCKWLSATWCQHILVKMLWNVSP